MEISKALHEEILSVQNKLKNAIRDHQICVAELKDDPNNTNIVDRIREIQLHIVTLGKWQKQVVQRLRKEVASFKAENANGVSIASLLGLNNNNHITNNNETKRQVSDAKTLNGIGSKSSKEDYEEIVRNGDVSFPAQENICSKSRSNSVESISAEEEIIEVPFQANPIVRPEPVEEEVRIENQDQLVFLQSLDLITIEECTDLQNKRAERKRRSTANPQFVYSNWETPTKRKRHCYLQSSANIPQTRQTTAQQRLNGPSPPPAKNLPSKSSTLPAKVPNKSLISAEKQLTSKPNILRGAIDTKVLVEKGLLENGTCSIQITGSSKTSPPSTGSKTVHIPGLPSSLTIERIENDSAICISCRNPGTLTICENCSAKFHVSCHTVSPASTRNCPKCVSQSSENDKGALSSVVCKMENEFATAPFAAGVAGKAREDSEVYKAARGLYKVDAGQKRNLLTAALGISQLPSSTFLIPISSKAIPATAVSQPENPSGLQVTTTAAPTSKLEQPDGYSSLLLNQLPSINPVVSTSIIRQSGSATDRSEQQQQQQQSQGSSHGYQPEKHQSYLIVKKIPESTAIRPVGLSSGQQSIQTMPVVNYKWSTGGNTSSKPELTITQSACRVFQRIMSRCGVRHLPELEPIYVPEKSSKHPDIIVEPVETETKPEIVQPPQLSPESSTGVLHSVFPVDQKPDLVPGGAPNVPIPAIDDVQRVLGEDRQPKLGDEQPVAGQQPLPRPEFTEHVKLEEAHLPAPPRAKLIDSPETVQNSELNHCDIDAAPVPPEDEDKVDEKKDLPSFIEEKSPENEAEEQQRYKELKERLDISRISPESLEMLEAFETAMAGEYANNG